MSNPRAAQLVEAGMWLRLSGDHEGARRLFEQALRLDPENARARQLLEAGPNAPVPEPPASEPAPRPPDYPFAPPPSTTSMDLDWGSATGFAPTPVPFIRPVAILPPRPPAEDLPPEVEIESTPVDLDDDPPVPTLVFGLKSPDAGVPDPAPTRPEPWTEAPISSSTMAFQGGSGDEVPWAVPQVPAAGGGTMQFPRPLGTVPKAPAAPGTGGTMQFSRPGEVPAPPSSGTKQFPSAPDTGGGTMQFARPTDSPALFGSTMQFARPAEPAQPELDEVEWEAPSAPSAVFAAPPPAPAESDREASRSNPYDFPPPGPPPSEPKFAPNATSAWDQRSNPGTRISDIAPGLGAALDLAASDRHHTSSPSGLHRLAEVKTLIRGAKDLLGLDDHSGAMDLILKAQELAPDDAEVQALKERSERTLEAMFESKLGKLTGTPRVKLKDDEIIWLNLDHRAGFVLAQIDGQVTFEDLFSVSGMSRLDTARILAQLIEEGVIVR